MGNELETGRQQDHPSDVPAAPAANDKERHKLIAELSTQGMLTNGLLMIDLTRECIPVEEQMFLKELKERVLEVQKGDMSTLEGMLTAQAVALDSMFCAIGKRGNANLEQYPNAAEKYLKLALKAQSQCRSTIEALAIIKNPQPYIQNNRAQYQQVNNAVLPHTREKPDMTNELDSHHAEAPYA